MSELALYRFFDNEDALLYVGITNRLERRMSDHRRDKPWWSKVSTIKVERFGSAVELVRAEIEAIEAERPRYNVAHSVVGAPQQIALKRGRVDSIAPDANRFATEVAFDAPYVDDRPLQCLMPLPCPHCGGRAHRECETAGARQPTGDVTCSHCATRWTYDEWCSATSISGTP